jgi:hypothetical protein
MFISLTGNFPKPLEEIASGGAEMDEDIKRLRDEKIEVDSWREAAESEENFQDLPVQDEFEELIIKALEDENKKD